MAATLIIQKQDDGSVLIAAPTQPIPPELMQNAEPLSVEDAGKAVVDVLGDGGGQQPGGDQQQPPGGDGNQPPADDSAQDGQPEPDADDAMQQGFTSVKGQPRR